MTPPTVDTANDDLVLQRALAIAVYEIHEVPVKVCWRALVSREDWLAGPVLLPSALAPPPRQFVLVLRPWLAACCLRSAPTFPLERFTPVQLSDKR